MIDAFENAFANAPIGMALIDMAGRFLQVNDALCRMTGYKRGELILMSARGLSHPDDVEVDASQQQALLDGHVTSYQCEKRYLHAWGHSFWVLVTVSLSRDDLGQPRYLILQCQDISERKELERQAALFSESDLVRFFHSLAETENKLRTATQPRYQLEVGLVKLMEMRRLQPLNQLIERISALETRLSTGQPPAPNSPAASPLPPFWPVPGAPDPPAPPSPINHPPALPSCPLPGAALAPLPISGRPVAALTGVLIASTSCW